MQALLVLLVALPLIAATAYVHYRLPIHVQQTAVTWLLRALLIAVGLGLGYVCLFWTGGGTFALRWAAFLFGFGAAHVPAFFVLFIKRRRGEYGRG